MAGYSESINRGQDTDGVIVPPEISNQIIQELPSQSVMLQRGKRATMSTKSMKQPVLSTLPEAYWVNGDTGMKQTTSAQWKGLVITAEELATIVVIPDAFVDDANIPLWDEVRPLLVEAIGKKVDQASLFGTDKPASWPTAVVPGAIAASNTVEATAPGTAQPDLAANVATLGQMLATDGFAANGFASQPGFNWQLVGLRDANGAPIYQSSLAQGTPNTLYGYPLNEVTNGAWDTTAATLLAADWTKFVVGVRQDITVKMFSEGVISDDAGVVQVNLMQQDAQAMRVVFRVGFQVANPLTRVNAVEASRYPAAVLTPYSAV